MEHCKCLLITSTLTHCKAKKSRKPSCAILLSKSVDSKLFLFKIKYRGLLSV